MISLDVCAAEQLHSTFVHRLPPFLCPLRIESFGVYNFQAISIQILFMMTLLCPQHGSTLPDLHLTSEEHTLATVLLFSGCSRHLIHSTCRLLDRSRRLHHPKCSRPMVAPFSLHEARVQDEGIKPLILGIDADPIPEYYGLGWSVRRIWDRGLTPVMQRSACGLSKETFSAAACRSGNLPK